MREGNWELLGARHIIPLNRLPISYLAVCSPLCKDSELVRNLSLYWLSDHMLWRHLLFSKGVQDTKSIQYKMQC